MTNFALEIDQLKKVYSGGTEALKGISLKVQEGDFYALLGPNGAGKSSTIGIIGTLVTKTSGTVKIFDIDIDKNVALAKSMLGVVSQEINFSQFEKIIDEANVKWNLIDTLIIHRYGKLQVNDKIVLVSSFSSHLNDSFGACNFIMDYLKKDAPFWKNEFYKNKSEWLINSNQID